MTTLVCPLGHQFKIPRVVYGYPAPETFEAAERGEVTIGGCMPDLPVERRCPTCGLRATSDPEWASRWASDGPNGAAAPLPDSPIRT